MQDPKFPQIRFAYPPSHHPERWSGTIDASGGMEVWNHLVSLPTAVVGCGATGSVLINQLARLGVKEMSLIDKDYIEAANLGEMDVIGDDDCYAYKANAIARRLQASLPNAGVTLKPIIAHLPEAEALGAAMGSWVLWTTVNNDTARLSAGLLALKYEKLLIDIETNVKVNESGNRRMNAVIRFIVPGDGCIWCRGQLADVQGAVHGLYQFNNISRHTRGCSSNSLNAIAVSIGLQMFLDWVSGRLSHSTLVNIETSGSGVMSINYPPIDSTIAKCPLCVKVRTGEKNDT